MPQKAINIKFSLQITRKHISRQNQAKKFKKQILAISFDRQ